MATRKEKPRLAPGRRVIVQRRKKNNPARPAKTTTASHTIGPFETQDLRLPRVINFLNKQNKGVLGAYENNSDPCLIAAENGAILCSRLMRYQSEYDCNLGTI